MKSVREYITARTLQPIMFISICLLFSATALSATDNPAVENEGIPAVDFTFIEADLLVEAWMTAPFENSYFEAELPVEDWMAVPFQDSYAEPALIVEDWMTAPF